MSKRPKKLKAMSPHEARTNDEICSLQSDNYSTAEGWLMIDGNRVTICQQRDGERAASMASFSRGAFKRMLDWYLRPQKRTDTSTGEPRV